MFLPTLDSRAKYFLILSLKMVIISQLFLCLLPTLPLNSAGASAESRVLMQCHIKLREVEQPKQGIKVEWILEISSTLIKAPSTSRKKA